MNKSELIDAISEQSELTKTESKRALDAILQEITTSLSNGDDVVLVGFGTFATKDRAARNGRNPSTGEVIQIAASRAVSFKPGKALKESVQ